MNVAIVEEWGDGIDYSGILFSQTAIKYTPTPIRVSYNMALLIREENLKYDHILIHSDKRISPKWILLNNLYTVDVFFKKILLKNVRKANCDLSTFLTGGKTTTNLVGGLPGYGTMWFRPGGIANILSFSKLVEKYQVCDDSTNGNEFLVYLPHVEMRHFQQCHRGVLYSGI